MDTPLLSGDLLVCMALTAQATSELKNFSSMISPSCFRDVVLDLEAEVKSLLTRVAG
ncbi:MAG TPA: hypothetical protein VJT72_03075 [Pseudonocardiaceae bacterium]|nr:hypothetical protein [Pseudonocardiaceae bacterium]